ncbi:MAG: DoxX family protein [bacterium]
MLERLLRRYQDFGLMILRLTVGIIFAIHGFTKIFHGGGMTATILTFTELGVYFPAITAWLVALGELFGGGCMILGLFTREAALYLTVIMAGAILTIHGQHGFFNINQGYEYNLMLIGACLCLLFSGGGSGAMDKVLFPQERWTFISDRSKIKLEPPQNILD